MSWVAVAKKDFRDAIRSKSVLGLTVLFTLFSGGFMFYAIAQADEQLMLASIIRPMSSASTKFVPLVSIVTAYGSIAGERESGSLKFLLGLPHTRFDVMVGKLVGRSLVVSLAIMVGYIAGIIPFLVFSISFSLFEFITLVSLTVLLGIVFIAIAVAFSTAMRSAKRALYGAVGVFVLFEWLWDNIPMFVIYIRNGFQRPEQPIIPEWLSFINLLDPQTAYIYAIAYLSPSPTGPMIVVVADEPYLQDWIGFVILAFWITVLLGPAYYRFHTMDLF